MQAARRATSMPSAGPDKLSTASRSRTGRDAIWSAHERANRGRAPPSGPRGGWGAASGTGLALDGLEASNRQAKCRKGAPLGAPAHRATRQMRGARVCRHGLIWPGSCQVTKGLGCRSTAASRTSGRVRFHVAVLGPSSFVAPGHPRRQTGSSNLSRWHHVVWHRPEAGVKRVVMELLVGHQFVAAPRAAPRRFQGGVGRVPHARTYVETRRGDVGARATPSEPRRGWQDAGTWTGAARGQGTLV